MSQRELARRTDRHPDVISRFAREATGKVSYELLADICGALGCEIGDLLEYVPDPDEQIGLFAEGEPSTNGQLARRLLRVADERARYGAGEDRSKGGGS